MKSKKPQIILDLCGGTGAWSKPYAEAGYEVINVTLPEHDVRLYIPPKNVHGILAAPPCTHFSIASNRLWRKYDTDGSTTSSIEVVRACLRIIAACEPEWWALENPAPPLCRIMKCVPELGKPKLLFDPCDYGDNYKKRTAIWGKFTRPPKWQCMRDGKSKVIENLYRKGVDRQELRSITPPGFAQAFFEANG